MKKSLSTGFVSNGLTRVIVTLCLVVFLMSVSGAGKAFSLGKMKSDDLDGGKGQPKEVYCTRPPCLKNHNIGRVNLLVTNLGFFGSPYVADLSMGWRGGEYLYVAGLWVGALDADGIPHVSTAAYETEFRPSLDPRDYIYEGYEGIPNGTRVTGITGLKGADDDGDGLVDEDFLDGYDNDGDGKIDEDFAAVSEQMFCCTYTDFSPEAMQRYPDHRPLYLKVQQSSFAWSVAGLDEFIGVDYKIWNAGQNPIRDVYVGFFVDADAGPKGSPSYWDDDLAGIVDTTVLMPYPEATNPECKWREKRLKIAFIRDVQEDEAKRLNIQNRGDVSGWAGMILLGHPTDVRGETAPKEVGMTTLKWFSSGGSYQEGGDPANDYERYDLMSKGTIPVKSATQPNDYRYCISVGPFAELKPDSFLSFQVAFVVGEGKEGLVSTAVAAQRTYDGRYEDVDKANASYYDQRARTMVSGPTPPSPYKETFLTPPMRWTNPCLDTVCAPSSFNINDSVCVEVKAPQWVDNDCDACTPGETGSEYPVRWLGETPPPPPTVERVGGSGKVNVEWDNLSETLPGSKFEGYRVWRVAGWQRPVGETKPREEEWQLVAEFYKHPPDSLEMDRLRVPRTSSPHHISAITDTTVHPTMISSTGQNVYPVGRYKYVDQDGVLDGSPYFYSVTAFSKWLTSSDTTRSEILGVRIDTTSTITGDSAIKDKLSLNIATGGFTRYAPKLAYGAGDYLAVWASNQKGSWDILGARVRPSDGRLIARADSLGIPISTALYTQHHPAVAYGGSSFFAVWEDSRNGPSDIYGSRIRVDGTVVDTSGILITAGLAYQYTPAIAFDGTNYLVVWADNKNGDWDVYGTFVDTLGNVTPTPVAIASLPGDQLTPKVAFDGTNYLVVWADGRGSSNDIYGNRISPSGSILDGTGFVISSARNAGGRSVEQNLPDVTFGAGQYFVVWADGRQGNYDIYGTRVAPAGTVVDTAGILITLASTSPFSSVQGHQYYPAVASSGQNYLVSWSDLRNQSVTSVDIYASRINAAGVLIDRTVSVLKISGAAQVQHSSAVAFDGTNYLIVWESRRVDDMAITVRWIELGGRPVSTEQQIAYARPDAGGKGYKVYVVPNPYKGRAEWDFLPAEYDPTGTKVGFFGMPKARATLKIYTLAGDLVQTIQHDGRDGNGAAYWNLVSRNGQDVVSGVYLFSVTSDLGNFVGKFVVIR